MELDSIYAEYFPEYSSCFGRALILMKSMYVMNNFGKLFSDYFTEWLLEAGLIQSQCQMSIYYNYAPDGTKHFVLSYVGDCVHWYTYEALGKCFMGTLGNILHVNFL